ncbi:MBL fold metallo-hydrolase, partial [Paenibacillus sepulcri]|nr:MBL fold metallo-hydrolase [Paenibacillus sepulcri]
MKIAEGIAALPIEMNFMGNSSVIYPTLLWDEDNIVLVDTGTPGMLPGIRTEIGRAGVDFDKLNTVILTHQDIDHIGSMPEIAAAAKQPLLVLAHEEDRSSIEGDRPFVKFNRERFGPR